MTVDATPIYQVFTVTRDTAGEIYPITFPYISPEYVKCYYAVEKEQTQLEFGHDYMVNSETNELTVVGSLPIDAKLVVYRVTDLTQEIDWVDGQAVYTPDIEQADDKLTHIVQELAEQTNRSVKITREEEAAGTNPEYRWEEIEQARNEVLQAKADTETARDESVEAKDIAVEAKDIVLEEKEIVLGIIDGAKTVALGEIDTAQAGALTAIETDKTNALNAIEADKQSALSAIEGSKQDALSGIADSIVTAEQTISTATATATSDIASAESGALDSISTAAQAGVASVTQAKDDAIADVNTSGAQWVQAAKDEADRSSIEADRSESAADRAEAIVDIGPATADKLGIVKIGQGISVTTDGTISADIPDIDVATKDKAGIVQIGNGLSVTAGGVVSADAQPVNIATANEAGIVKPNADMAIEADGTITDKREVLYYDAEPAGGLPTDNVKDGALAVIDDGNDVVTLEDIATKTAEILADSLPSGGGSSGGSGEIPELTQEHVVGYLNGKPVYELLVQTSTPNKIVSSFANFISLENYNIDKVISMDAMFKTSDGRCFPNNYYTSSSTFVSVGFENGWIIEKHGAAQFSGNETHIVMRYTKTTD